MKKFLSILLIIVMVLSLFTTIAFATETAEDAQSEETQGLDITEEQLYELLEGTDYEGLIQKQEYMEAKVLNAGSVVEDTEEGTIVQDCEVEILQGEKKGERVEAKAILGYKEYSEGISESFKKGDYVYITFVQDLAEDGTTIVEMPYIVELNRVYAYIALAIIVIVLLILVCWLKGLEIIGITIYNALILVLGIIFMYYKQLNEVLSFSTITILLIIGNSLILNKFKKETIVLIISSIISVVLEVGILIVINMNFRLSGFVGKFDASALIMTIPIIGITIDVIRKTISKAKEGKNFKLTLRDVFETMPSKYNMIILIWLAFFIENAVSMYTYLADNEYPFSFMNFGSIVVEISKLAIMIIAPLVAVPITILLSKEILKIKKAIDAPSEKVIDIK